MTTPPPLLVGLVPDCGNGESIRDRFARFAARTARIDLSKICSKIMHPNPVIGLGWDRSFLERVQTEYRIFFTMHAAFPQMWLPPSRPLDLFWHEHLLDTRAYFADCEQVAGHYLHHLPYFGMRNEADIFLCLQAFQAERQLYLQCVGQEPPKDLWIIDCTEEIIRSLVAGCFIAAEGTKRHG